MKTLCFVAFAASAFPAAAETVWDCRFPDKAQGQNIVTGQVLIRQEAGAAEASVNSPLIEALHGKPIAARIMIDKPEQFLAGWEFKLKNDRNQHTRMKYRLNIVRGGAQASLSAQPLGYDNSFSNSGRCTKVRG